MFYQAFFFVLVMAVQIGLVAFCMIGASSALTRFHAPQFWRGILIMPLTACFIGIGFGTGIYLQGKLKSYQERGKTLRNRVPRNKTP